MATTFVIPSVFTAIDKFSGPVKQMGGALQGFVSRSERMLGRANAAFSKLISPLTSINKMLMGLGVYLGLFTLVRVVKNAIDIFANFQQANADLAVVMGVSVKQNKVLADDARRVGLAYGEAATDVVKMQHALATLGFEQPDILKMGRPLITGSAALEGANPEKLAETVGAVINTFDNLTPDHTQHILDVMALSANRTALNFEKLATTLPIVSGPANAVGISFERLVALLGILQNAGVHVATSATSLKNIFIDSAKKGHTYEQVLANIAKHSDKLVAANKKFGKRSVVSALALIQHMNDAKNGVKALTTEFEKAKLGLTELIATDRLNTFRGAQKLLNAAWHEFVLSIEDGNGPIAMALTRILKVAAAVLLLSSDSDQAREAVAKLDKGIIDSAKKWIFWLNVIKWVAIAIVGMKLLLWAWETAIIAFNVVTGIWTGLMYGLEGAIWLVNIAMAANPIGLIIIAIAALIALVIAAVACYNDWGAAVLYLIGPIGWLINLIQAFRRNWDMIKNSFKEGGILKGLLAIGKVILDAILMPFQQIAKIIANITGADWAMSAVEQIEKFRSGLGVNTATDENGKLLTPAINPRMSNEEREMKGMSGNVNLNIVDPYGYIKDVKSDSSFITPRVSTTNSFE